MGASGLTATIGKAAHKDAFAFRVFGGDRACEGRNAVVETSLRSLAPLIALQGPS
jgi:hypothetical protein